MLICNILYFDCAHSEQSKSEIEAKRTDHQTPTTKATGLDAPSDEPLPR